MESKIQELQHALVLVCRHWQGFHESVGELDQPVAVVGQNEILVLAPSSLVRKQVGDLPRRFRLEPCIIGGYA